MTVGIQMSVEEYLRTSFPDADREYLDGEVVERKAGAKPHSKAQRRLVALFDRLAETRPLHVFPELRVRVSPRRFRVVDVAVYAGEEPGEEAPSEPAWIAIEILSREDRYAEILEKFNEYQRWGVRHIWFVDPWLAKIHVYGKKGLQEVTTFLVPEHDLEIPAASIFR